MSDYLVQRTLSSTKIELHNHTEITALSGDTYLREITWANRLTGQSESKPIGHLFVMIGAEPNTEWLNGSLNLHAKGFIQTGRDREGRLLPSPYATELPGIFAVEDVRSGSVKRAPPGLVKAQ